MGLPPRRRYTPQHPVPGQNPPMPAPYVPSIPADIAQIPMARSAQRREAQPFVVSTFDARPVNGIDFLVRPVAVATNYPADPRFETNTYSFDYVVPGAFSGVLTGVSLVSKTSTGAIDGGLSNDPGGADLGSSYQFGLSIRVNGNVVPGFENIDAQEAFSTGIAFDCFIAANPNDTISVFLTIISDTDADPAIELDSVVYMGGVLLQYVGEQANIAIGTLDPLPVSPIMDEAQ